MGDISMKLRKLYSALALVLALVLLFSACNPHPSVPDVPDVPDTPGEEEPGDESWEGGFFRPLSDDVRSELDSIYAQKLAATQSFAPVTTHGTVYYVSSVNGNDNYSGKSPDRPWKTLSNCAARVKKGDTILFECGSVFRRAKNDYFIRGLANGVTLASYGEGAKPIFYGSVNVPANKWKRVGDTDIYYFDGSSLNLNIYNDVGAIIFDEGKAWGVKTLQTFNDPETKEDPDGYTLALSGVSNGLTTRDYPSYEFQSGTDLQGDLSFFHDYAKKRIYLCCEGGNPGTRFSSVELSLSMFAFSMQNPATDLTVLNLDFRNFGSHVLRPMNCENFTVKNCEFRFVGGAIQWDYGTWRNYYTRLGNAVENWNACNGMTVENCYFDQIYDTAATTQSNSDVSSKNIIYKNNVMKNVWFGVELWTTSNVEFSGVNVSGNYCTAIGEGLTSQRPDKIDPDTTFSVNAFIKVSGGPYDTKGSFSVVHNYIDGTNGKMLFCNYPKGTTYPNGILFDYNTYVGSTDVDFARFFGKTTGVTYAYTENGVAAVWVRGIEQNGKFYYT